jgi:Xaa-Pro aminopeptidase/Xaa-Pro dipeptidase
MIRSGMVFTVEPGVYLPGLGGVRIEDMLLAEKQGCRILTSLPKKLEIL